jgi:hypothetical protein
MGFISRLRKVTGKEAEAQEARIKARDAAERAEFEDLVENELDETPALRAARAKVRALQEAAKKGEGGEG